MDPDLIDAGFVDLSGLPVHQETQGLCCHINLSQSAGFSPGIIRG